MEPQADSSLEPPRAKRDPSNPKRAPGRSEALAGRTPLSPGLLSGPSAKRAVYLKAAPSEEEPNARVVEGPEPSKGHGGKAGSRRNGRGGQSEAPSPATDPSLPLQKVMERGPEQPLVGGGGCFFPPALWVPQTFSGPGSQPIWGWGGESWGLGRAVCRGLWPVGWKGAHAPAMFHHMPPCCQVELLEKEPMPVEMQPLVDPSETFPLPATTCLEKRVLPPAEAARGWECTPAPGEGPKAAPVIAAPLLLSRDNEKRDWSKDEAALEATVDGRCWELHQRPGLPGCSEPE